MEDLSAFMREVGKKYISFFMTTSILSTHFTFLSIVREVNIVGGQHHATQPETTQSTESASAEHMEEIVGESFRVCL